MIRCSSGAHFAHRLEAFVMSLIKLFFVSANILEKFIDKKFTLS